MFSFSYVRANGAVLLFSLNLSIPGPSTQVVQVGSIQTGASSKASHSKQLKKGKPIEATKALTAWFVLRLEAFVCLLTSFFRNLYAIEYLKDHLNTTPAEFRVVYDGLAPDIKKVRTLLIPTELLVY